MVIRLLLTAGTLVVVWRHSHWSVALVLTMMAINNEVSAYVSRGHAAVLHELIEGHPSR